MRLWKPGCGLDRLDWDRVEHMLKDILPDLLQGLKNISLFGKEIKTIPFIVEENLKKDFYKKSENKFDPQNNILKTDFIDEYKNAKVKNREIPEFMLKMKV